MPLEDVCQHTAVLRRAVAGAKVEGDYVETRPAGPTFDCVFFPPNNATEEATVLRRVVLVPTLLHYGEDRTGALLTLRKDDELELTEAPGLASHWLGRWQVSGEPAQFGPPGEDEVGEQAFLRRVRE